MRFSGSLLAALACTLLGACTVEPAEEPARQPAGAAPVSVEAKPHGRVARAREILREWDRRRARAWATADPEALAALYLPGSVAGRRDVARLERWAERGLRVEGLAMQVFEIDVVRWRAGRITVRVLDRVLAASPRLPRDTPTARVVELVRGAGDEWVVGSVRPG